VKSDEPHIVHLRKSPRSLFKEKKKRFDALERERKQLEYIIIKKQNKEPEWEPNKRSMAMLA